MASSYHVKEVFQSVQGEAYYVGRPAVFVRFAGCNMWSGIEADRMEWYGKTGSLCALFCDTDFTKGEKFTVQSLVERVKEIGKTCKFIVVTGGEPGLQYDEELHLAFKAEGYYVAMETNGCVKLKVRPDWVTISPKLMNEQWINGDCDELKVVYPAYDPLVALEQLKKAKIQPLLVEPILFVQPEDSQDKHIATDNIKQCIEFVLAHPKWRLSLQTHKMIGMP
jgi:organic radical activating enzyme